MEANTLNLPVLALRGLTVFPHTNLTFDVERRISIKALEVAMESGQEIFLVTQRELNTDRPGEKDLYTMGTISRVTQILRLGKNSLRVMVEGGRRHGCAACGRQSLICRATWRWWRNPLP